MKFVILGWMHLAYAIKFTDIDALYKAVDDCIDDSSVGDCARLYGGVPIGKWDVSAVTEMSALFVNKEFFNQPLGEWDVRNVNNMQLMFFGAKSFNQSLSQWDVRNVTTMNSMFSGADTFSGDISTWEVSSLRDMGAMFMNALHFNCDLSQWDVSKVTTMEAVFAFAYEFNQDISLWDTSSVTDMDIMFYSALAFNHDLSFWNINNVSETREMFWGNTVVGIQLCSALWAVRAGDDMFGGGSKWSISSSATCKTRTLPRPPPPPSLSPPSPLQPGGAWVTRVRFDVKFVISGRRTRQLQQTGATANEVAIRDLLRPLLGDAPNVVVGATAGNRFPVTITLDSAPASRVNKVENLVSDVIFATALSDRLGQLVIIESLKTSEEAVGAPTPPPSAPLPPSPPPLIAILSVGAAAITAFVLYGCCRRYVCRHNRGTLRQREFVIENKVSLPVRNTDILN